MVREYIVKIADDVTEDDDVLYGKPAKELIRRKDCKHRPYKYGDGDHEVDFQDSVCPCQNSDDDWYSWYPTDDWYCPDGERR